MKRRSRARRWRRSRRPLWRVYLDPQYWRSLADYVIGDPLELEPGEADVAPTFTGEIGVFRGFRFRPLERG